MNIKIKIEYFNKTKCLKFYKLILFLNYFLYILLKSYILHFTNCDK